MTVKASKISMFLWLDVVKLLLPRRLKYLLVSQAQQKYLVSKSVVLGACLNALVVSVKTSGLEDVSTARGRPLTGGARSFPLTLLVIA